MLKLDSKACLNGEPVRYVAMGDSFTEGVGDADTRCPNGVRGWADRFARMLGEHNQQTRYANLAIRGYLVDQIIARQLETALELGPNLVSLYGGGNDILRPNAVMDRVVNRIADGFAALRATGAEVLTITGLDIRGEGPFARTRGRTAIYNELLREAAEEYGVHVVDFWRMRDFLDWRLWSDDKLHMNALGHQKFAARVAELVGLPGTIPEPVLPPEAQLTRYQELGQNARWVKEFALPWVGRRIRRTSSGDGLEPKYGELLPAASLYSERRIPEQ